MKRILLYHGKDNYMAWDATTNAQAEQAMIFLFKYIDEVCNFYGDLIEMESELYKKSLAGDIKSIKRLLSLRRHAEYEWWQFIDVL